jgi:hypothetical protein
VNTGGTTGGDNTGGTSTGGVNTGGTTGGTNAGGSSTGGSGGGGKTCVELESPSEWALAFGADGIYQGLISPNLGDPAFADFVRYEAWSDGTGPFALGEGTSNATYADCAQCLFVDVDAVSHVRTFFAIGGAITIDAASDPQNSELEATATDVTLQEQTSEGELIADGDCFHLSTLQISFHKP